MMNQYTTTSPFTRTGLAMALAITSLMPIAAIAKDKPVMPMKDGDHTAMPPCKAMMESRKEMHKDMKDQTAALTKQIAKMNAAPQDQKTDLIAACLTTMVEQRTAMDARRAKMSAEMTQHKAQHMEMGKKSMTHCPMAKGMKK